MTATRETVVAAIARGLSERLRREYWVDQVASQIADDLIAAGVTLPPEPEPAKLVTWQIRDEALNEMGATGANVPLSVANTLVAAAIRARLDSLPRLGRWVVLRSDPNDPSAIQAADGKALYAIFHLTGGTP
jgi:hypothetical protein